MKTTCLLFLTISWAAWSRGTGYAALSQQASVGNSANTSSGHPRDVEYAAPADAGTHQKDGKAPHDRRGHGRASDLNRPPKRPSLTKVNRPQHPNSRLRPISENAISLHQAGYSASFGAAKAGFIQNEPINRAVRARPLSVIRSTEPSFGHVRHRSANPAVVGGLALSHRANTGAINGTRMNRKP